MSPSHSSATVKVLSPTLHLYHYVLRNAINERPETLENRRKFFSENLQKLASNLKSSTGISGSNVVKLVPIEQDLAPSGTIIDFTNVPPECRKPNDDRLYFNYGIINSRLAARRLNDTYLLRFTSYVPSAHQEQPLPVFANLGENIASLPLEIGQTVILAAILPESQYSPQDIRPIAATCLSSYYGTQIEPDKLIQNKFLDSPFCIYAKPVTVKQFNEYAVESIHLTCVFLYKDQAVEQQADKVYRILQDLLLSYHKIHFFYSQSITLKKVLSKQYEAIERLTEEYANQKWDSQSLKKLPQQSLEYYKRLSFLEDQAKLVEVNLKNYQYCIQQIEQQTNNKVPEFFGDFQNDIVFYLEQMKANIGFLTPGIQLFEKLMLSVQTQVGIDEEIRQEKQEQLQAQLAQILTVAGTAIGLGQIITPPITTTLSQQIDPANTPPSLTSSWLGAVSSILLSLIIGYLTSIIVYRWLTKGKR